MSERIGSHGWRIWKEENLPQEVVPLSDAEGVVAALKRENEELKDTIRIDWEVIVDAIDDHDIKQAAIRLWNRVDAQLTAEESE